MGVRPGRSLWAVLAGSLVFASVVVGSLIGGGVAASAITPTTVNCNAGGDFAGGHHCRLAGSDAYRARDLPRELHHRREPGLARLGRSERGRVREGQC